ncbi:MAG: PilZ domain-containing protein [Candidatus Omnitrophica bacterium]|nr:PilZ domain-containing protein [Candidatus Omnitrophota bacterium]
MKEKRKFLRVDFDKAVLWRSVNTLDNIDKIKNISEGGICVIIESDKIEKDDILQIEFYSPKGKVMFFKVKVSWVDRKQSKKGTTVAGIRFIDTDKSSILEIRNYVGICHYNYVKE